MVLIDLFFIGKIQHNCWHMTVKYLLDDSFQFSVYNLRNISSINSNLTTLASCYMSNTR